MCIRMAIWQNEVDSPRLDSYDLAMWYCPTPEYRKRLADSGLRLHELAERAKVSAKTIFTLEKNGRVASKSAQRICAVLKANLIDIFISDRNNTKKPMYVNGILTQYGRSRATIDRVMFVRDEERKRQRVAIDRAMQYQAIEQTGIGDKSEYMPGGGMESQEKPSDAANAQP